MYFSFVVGNPCFIHSTNVSLHGTSRSPHSRIIIRLEKPNHIVSLTHFKLLKLFYLLRILQSNCGQFEQSCFALKSIHFSETIYLKQVDFKGDNIRLSSKVTPISFACAYLQILRCSSIGISEGASRRRFIPILRFLHSACKKALFPLPD